MKNDTTFKVLLISTTLFIVAYWISVFTGVFPVEEIVPGYVNWFMSFPIPDLYIATGAFLGIYFLKSNRKLAGLFGILTGSGLLFLGLYALSYGHNTGLLYSLTPDELFEIGIKAYCLTAGTFFIRHAWKMINE